MTETELKLAINPGDLDKIRQIPFVISHLKSDPETLEMESRYFDTPDQRLAKNGVALRLRSSGDGWIQTVKAPHVDNGGVLSVYDEHEMEVDGENPRFKGISTKNGASCLNSPKVRKNLQEVFATHINRTAYELELGKNVIEMVLDSGKVVAGDEHSAIHQIELELKKGSTDSLFALAREIAAVVAVRPINETKTEMGYHLLNHTRREPVKRARLKIPRKMKSEAALSLILSDCLNQIRENESILEKTNDSLALRQLRIGLRRFESALFAFQPVISKKASLQIREPLQEIRNSLEAARHWDVLVEEQLLPIRENLPKDQLFIKLDQAARKKRSGSYLRVRNLITSAAYGQAILAAEEWVSCRKWRLEMTKKQRNKMRTQVQKLAPVALGKGHRGLKKRVREMEATDGASWQMLRNRVKKHEDIAGFFQGCYSGSSQGGYHKAFRKLTRDLDQLHDLTTSETLLDEIGSLKGTGPADLKGCARSARGWRTCERIHLEAGLMAEWLALESSDIYWRE